MHLQREIDQSVFFVERSNGSVGIVRLKLIEVSELVQAEQAQLPQAGVIDVAFFEGDFTANDLIARGGIALELDAPHKELLAFIDVNIQKNLLLIVVEMGIGNRSEVDVAKLSVGLTQIF